MKKLYLYIIGAVDVILLIVILTSLGKKPGGGQTVLDQNTHAPFTEVPSPTDGQPMSASSAPYASAVPTDIPTPYSVPTAAPTIELTERPTDAPIDPSQLSTDEYASEADAANAVLDGSNGFSWAGLSSAARQVTDLSEAMGGWKAVIVSSPESPASSVTYYLNLNISGNANDITVTLGWHTYRINSTGQTAADPQSPSVYSGSWTNGTIYAQGAGSISIYDICFDNGMEYGLGTIFWPDANYGFIAFVRP